MFLHAFSSSCFSESLLVQDQTTKLFSLPRQRRDAGAMEFTHKFFKKIMWRSSKVHVADELQLPPQEECLSWLTLSPVEEHFYQRQHETCVSYAREVIESLKDDIMKRKLGGCYCLF